jgi:signal transduction histidine kinase
MVTKPTYEELKQRVRELEQESARLKQTEEEVRHRLIYESALSQISTMAVQAEDIAKFQDESLAIIGQTMDVSRAYIFEHHSETDTMVNTVEWCSSGVFPQKDHLQSVPADAAPWWVATLKEGEIICFEDIEDIPDEGAKEILRPQGILSILVAPLFVAGRYYGFIGFDECSRHRKWPPEDVDILLAMYRIITGVIDRQRAEQALQFEHSQLLSIFDGIDEPIYVSDPKTYEVLFINRALAAKLKQDPIGRMCYREFQGFESPCPFCTNEIILKQYPTAYQWEHYNPVIRKFYSLHDRIIQWPDGRGVRIEMAVDITERKQAEKDREKLQAQLNQAQKMESIGALAGGIAHNFNNVLMGIQGRASLMLMDKDPSHSDYEHLNGIEQCVRSAAELTRDLLGFARKGKYEIKPTALNSLIKNENRMFGSTKKEIRFHEKYAKDLWVVEVDQGQIRQALLNLYVNAWQAMPGGGELYIQTDNIALDGEYLKSSKIIPGRYVRISVTDTGIGMDDAIREKIFEPFFSTKEAGQGSGMGLASVYGIIKNHGGFLRVYSEKGEGTSFSIYLPASEREVVEESSGTLRDDIQYGRGTILLVDDEDMIVEVGRKGLESLGYQVLVALSGEEALDIYGKQKDEIDLVMLDMIMPGMGGGETFDRLKALDGSVRVLLSSGYSINGRAQEILDRGCRAFIQKPFTLKELSQKVKAVFTR